MDEFQKEIDELLVKNQARLYVPVVLKVIKSDSDGPRLFEMVRYDETVHLQGGEHFWIVYGPEELARRVS